MLYRSPALGEGAIAGPITAREGLGPSAVSDRLHDGTPVRRLSRRVEMAGKPVVIRVARSEVPLRRQLRETACVLILMLPVALILAAAVPAGGPLSFAP